MSAPSPLTGLHGQVAIVTGAAGGIGYAVSATLADNGATVIMADIDAAGCQARAAELRRTGVAVRAEWVDVSQRDAVKELVDGTLAEFGHIDVLVNNGALDAPTGSAWEISPEHWTRIIDVNLSGQWWCSQAVLPSMMTRRSGRIIFISSVSARMGDPETSVAYNAAKAGLIGLTIGLSRHVEGSGVLVNAIAPGPTGTGRPMTDAERERTLAAMPLGLGGPQPIADACLYLAGSGGSWMSGSILNVSGGMWRG
jgi:NAD(P)-dependent dehydrogenase (short-subunit alcohol dehydrogenase family)